MTIIDINEFGGMVPSVRARDLPATAAQVAINLDQRFQDFRPSQAVGTSLTTVASAAKSVFRTPITGTWLSSALDVDYVPNLIQDLTSERVFLTGKVAYPEAWGKNRTNGVDQVVSPTYRYLGVPTPTVAPTFEVVPAFQFPADDAATYRLKTIKTFQEAITDNLTRAYSGYSVTTPTALSDGAYWLPHGTSTVPSLPTSDARMGVYCVPVIVSGGSYKVINVKHKFVVDPKLNGVVVLYLGVPYLAVPLYANGAIYSFSSAGFKADAATIVHPNPAVGTQLLPDPVLDEFAANITASFSTTASPAKEMITDLNFSLSEAVRLLNPPAGDMIVQETVDVYTAALATGGTIDTAAYNLARTLYANAKTLWNLVDSSGGVVFVPGDIPRERAI